MCQLMILFTCAIIPQMHTIFILYLMGWIRSVYIALTVKLNIYKDNFVSQKDGNAKNISIHEVDHDLEMLLTIQRKIHDGFMKYLLSVSLLTYLAVILICSVKNLNNYENFIVFVPMVECLYMTAILGYQADCTIHEVRPYDI